MKYISSGLVGVAPLYSGVAPAGIPVSVSNTVRRVRRMSYRDLHRLRNKKTEKKSKNLLTNVKYRDTIATP